MIFTPSLLTVGYAQQPAKPAAPATDYSKEPFVVEQYRTAVRYQNDGTGSQDLAVRIRVQSDAGVKRLGELVFGYNASSERLDVGSIRVRKADGSVVTVGPEAVKDLASPVAREAPVYTDYREKHVTVPALRPGEILEYHLVRNLEHPLAPGQFWFEHDFSKDAIVLDERLELNVPRDRAVKLKTQPEAPPQITETGDRRIYVWTSTNLRRETEEESKKKEPEEPKAPAIQLTTFQSWDEVGRWYAALEHDRIVPTPEIRARAEELVRGKTSELERMEALYDYVATNVRYVSLSFGLGRYQPHAASEIFVNQYGDCKDKHTLLAAMLAAVGVGADAVLIPSVRKVDPDVPSPSQFDHVITVVPLGKDFLWMDTTLEVAPFRLLSANLRNKQALVIMPDGSALLATPADPPFPSTQHVEIAGRVSELGKLTAHVHYTLRGDNELLLRVAFHRAPQSRWQQIARLVAVSDGFRGEVSNMKASSPTALHDPFEFEFDVAQPNDLDWSSRRSSLALPLPAIGMPESDENTSKPIQLGTPLEVSTQLKLELPANYSAPAPVGMMMARDYAEYRSTYKAVGNVITAERVLRFRMRELPAARASDYAAFTRAVRADDAQRLAVENTNEGAPAIPRTAKVDDLNEAGGAALESGNLTAAVELFKRVVELEPKHKSAWSSLGRAYLGLDQIEPAITAFRQQIEVNPYGENAYNYLGLALLRQQKFDEAATAFRKQVEVNPLDRFAHASLGSLYVQQRKFADAVTELEKALALTPGNPALQVSLGQAYLNLGQTKKALATFNNAVEKAPSPAIWNNVAYELARHSLQLERAQQYAESAVAATAAQLRNVGLDHLTPADLARTDSLGAYWDTLGWVYFERGDLERAEKFVAAAWQLAQRGEVGDHLGQICEKRGRKREAIHTYALALAAPRPVPETRGRLAALLGGESKIDSLVSRTRAQLSQARTIPLGKLLKESGTAEFFVLLSAGAKTEGVKFISGSEKLKPFAEALRAARYPEAFPDDTPTHLVRRGILSCSAATGECVFVLLTPDAVTSTQ